MSNPRVYIPPPAFRRLRLEILRGMLGAFALSMLMGCDLKIPSPTSYALPGETSMQSVPFHSNYTSALTWHPDGRRLAIAERAGAEAELVGLKISDPQVRKLNLNFRFLNRFEFNSPGQWLMGESNDGRLLAWRLDGSPLQVFFADTVRSGLWSMSANGAELLYSPKPANLRAPIEIRLRSTRNATRTIVTDTSRSIREARLAPTGESALVLSSEIRAGRLQSLITQYALPSGEKKLLRRSAPLLSRLAFSRDATRFAFMRERAAANDLMIFDLRRGLIDSLMNVRPALSDLVWMENDRWIAAFTQAYNTIEIRAYDLHTRGAVILAQHLPFSQRYLLFAVDDLLAFFVQSPERVSVFDQRDGSLTPWFTVPAREGNMQYMEWDGAGEKILIGVETERANSIFYSISPQASQRYPKSARYQSVSFHPDGQHFLAISSALQPANTLNLANEMLTTNERQALPSRENLKSVHAHPSGRFAGLLTERHAAGSFLPQNTLHILDLSTNTFIDSLALPKGYSGKFQWLTPRDGDAPFAAIWQKKSGYAEYFYLSFAPRSAVLVQSSAFDYPFAVVPKQKKFSLLQRNILVTLPLDTAVEP